MNPPPRFSYDRFATYADTIGLALRAFPAPVPVPLRGRKPTGVAQPLRDALTAKTLYKYSHPAIDEHLWSKHGTELIVSIRPDGSLAIGRDFKQALVTIEDTVPACNLKYLSLLCFLLHNRAFSPPLSFRVIGITITEIERMTQKYDVSFTETDEKGTYTVI